MLGTEVPDLSVRTSEIRHKPVFRTYAPKYGTNPAFVAIRSKEFRVRVEPMIIRIAPVAETQVLDPIGPPVTELRVR